MDIPGLTFCGISTYYSGNFNQSEPTTFNEEDMVYGDVMNELFQSIINVVNISKKSQFFDENADYGES